LWLGENHAEALATLNYGILDNKGFLLLTGAIGSGKTMLINSLVKQIDSEVMLATISDPQLKLIDFYNILSDEFGMDKRFESKGDFLIHLKKFLIAQHAMGKKVILIVDEAQRLTHDLMDEIRVLSNIELAHCKLINIFFVGQREFKNMLLEDRNLPLRQRITYNYHLDPLTQHETAAYVAHRLTVAGAAKKIFTEKAIREIYDFSKGVPRLINIICDDGLVTGYSKGTTMINEDLIKECANELKISTDRPTEPSEQPVATSQASPEENQDTIRILEQMKSLKNHSIFKEMVKIFKEMVEYFQKFKPATYLPSLKTAGIGAIILILIAMTMALFTSPQSGPSANIEKPNTDSITSEEAGERANNLHSKKKNLQTVAEHTKNDKAVIEKAQNEKSSQEFDTLKEPPDIQLEKSVAHTDSTVEIAEIDLTGSDDSEAKRIIASDVIESAEKPVAKIVKPPIKPQLLIFSEQKFVIYFKSDSTELDDRAFEEIYKIVELASRLSDSQILIKGYSDSYGNIKFNKKLSQYRADIVKSFLVANGISKSSITATGLGSKSPVGDNKTWDGRRKNRRVEVKVKQKSNDEMANYADPII
jgi:general secretion pathway protein A